MDVAAATKLVCEAGTATETWGRETEPVDGMDWPWVPEPVEGGGSSALRILVPYNGTAAARRALEVAAEVSIGRPALAWILYVRHWDVARGGTRFCLEDNDEARRTSHAGVAELRRRGVPASGVIRDAARERIGHTVVGEAVRLDVGCIVIGTHAHGRFIAALTGSVPRQVTRSATMPVIVVRHPRTARTERLGRFDPTSAKPLYPGAGRQAGSWDSGSSTAQPGRP